MFLFLFFEGKVKTVLLLIFELQDGVALKILLLPLLSRLFSNDTLPIFLLWLTFRSYYLYVFLFFFWRIRAIAKV